MKRIALSCVLALASTSAFAGSALVVSDLGCNLPDGNGGLVFTTDSLNVRTQSENGNAMFRCNADVAPSLSGSAAHFDFNSTGLQCGVFTATGFELTTDWNATVSASGKARLTCHVRD
ncbi:MAG TPA: hypothetical protein VFS82_10870 [Lysobacter sp.]|nr:hypothetical protein [Lysobacter sp.]